LYGTFRTFSITARITTILLVEIFLQKIKRFKKAKIFEIISVGSVNKV